MDNFKTPYYVLDGQKIEENYQLIKRRMEPCRIFYSMKANPEREAAEVLYALGSSFEISSVAEARLLQEIGVEKEKIYCGLPVMTTEQLKEIKNAGCGYFVFDTEREWKLLNQYAPDAKKILRIYVADLIPGSIDYGMPQQSIENFIRNHNTGPDGYSFHISDHTDMERTVLALERAECFLQKQREPSVLNIGGSYNMTGEESGYGLLRDKMKGMADTYGASFLCEPGAAIINSAGSIVSRCVYAAYREGFCDVFLDAGIPSGLMRKPGKVLNRSRPSGGSRMIYRFFDTTSMKKLLFLSILKLEIQEGDLLEFTDYGAYSICYSNRFHSQPKPRTVVKKGDESW